MRFAPTSGTSSTGTIADTSGIPSGPVNFDRYRMNIDRNVVRNGILFAKVQFGGMQTFSFYPESFPDERKLVWVSDSNSSASTSIPISDTDLSTVVQGGFVYSIPFIDGDGDSFDPRVPGTTLYFSDSFRETFSAKILGTVYASVTLLYWD